VPFVALRVAEYGTPTIPYGRLVVVMVRLPVPVPVPTVKATLIADVVPPFGVMVTVPVYGPLARTNPLGAAIVRVTKLPAFTVVALGVAVSQLPPEFVVAVALNVTVLAVLLVRVI
jgi:hypothetical protein